MVLTLQEPSARIQNQQLEHPTLVAVIVYINLSHELYRILSASLIQPMNQSALAISMSIDLSYPSIMRKPAVHVVR